MQKIEGTNHFISFVLCNPRGSYGFSDFEYRVLPTIWKVGRGGCPSKKFRWTHLGLNGPIVLYFLESYLNFWFCAKVFRLIMIVKFYESGLFVESFFQKSAERESQKKYFSYFIFNLHDQVEDVA